jgi:hypothetical protein
MSFMKQFLGKEEEEGTSTFGSELLRVPMGGTLFLRPGRECLFDAGRRSAYLHQFFCGKKESMRLDT